MLVITACGMGEQQECGMAEPAAGQQVQWHADGPRGRPGVAFRYAIDAQGTVSQSSVS